MVSWQRYTQLMWMICGRWVVAAKGLIEDQGEGWTTGWCACKNRRGGNFHKAKWHLLTQAPEYPCGPGQSNKGSLSLFLVRHDGQFTFSLLSPRPRHWYLPQLPPFSTPSLCMLFVPKCLNQLHLLTSHPQLLHPTSLLLLYILDCMRLLFFLTFFTTMFLWRLHSFFMFFLGYCTPTFSSSCQMSPNTRHPCTSWPCPIGMGSAATLKWAAGSAADQAGSCKTKQQSGGLSNTYISTVYIQLLCICIVIFCNLRVTSLQTVYFDRNVPRR